MCNYLCLSSKIQYSLKYGNSERVEIVIIQDISEKAFKFKLLAVKN